MFVVNKFLLFPLLILCNQPFEYVDFKRRWQFMKKRLNCLRVPVVNWPIRDVCKRAQPSLIKYDHAVDLVGHLKITRL